MRHLEAIIEANKSEPEGETVTISRKEYMRLVSANVVLEKLEAAGVNNWEGYSEAFQGDEDEEDD